MPIGYDRARHFGLSAVAAAIVAQPAVAKAQPVTPPAAAAAENDVEEIVVTAQRRAERLEDVPLSVTAVTGQDLILSGVTKFEDIGNISPSTRIGRTGIFAQPAIRGISSSTVSTGQENNVAIYVDGFYQPDPTALANDFANVRSVQVLKGPQGTLYGRNATGGALLIDTFEPSDDHLILDSTATYGNRDDVRLRAYVGVPIAPGLSIGVGGYYRDNDGYIRDVARFDSAPFRSWEVRTKVKMEPTTDFGVTFGYNHSYLSDPRGIAYSPRSEVYLGGLPIPPVGPLRTDQRDTTALDTRPINVIRQDEGTLKLRWTSGLGTLSSYTSFQKQRADNAIDFDGTKVKYITSTSNARRDTFTQSADFAFKPLSRLDVTVGGLYFDNRARNPNGAAIILGTLSTLQSTRLDTKAYAAFIDATLQLGEKLFLNAGARYSHERKTVAAEYLFRAAGGPVVIAPPTSATFSDVTPRATIRYEIGDRTNIYASYSQGFKSGTFNTVGATALSITTPVKPEKVDAYEIGAKTARGALHAETAAYYYDYRNLQVSSLQTVGSVPTTFLTNAASARIYGAEASISAALTEAFNLRFGGAWTHARYRSFPAASVQLIVPVVVGGQVIGTRNLAGQSQDFSGRRVARAPDWTGNLGADYTIPIGGGKLVLAGNIAYSSKYNPTNEVRDPATGKPRFEQKPYVLGSVSADYTLPGDHITIGAYAENVGNTRYKILDTANGQGSYAIYNEPRAYGVRAGYRY
jgi:iron complex outermembrane receptor protein